MFSFSILIISIISLIDYGDFNLQEMSLPAATEDTSSHFKAADPTHSSFTKVPVILS